MRSYRITTARVIVSAVSILAAASSHAMKVNKVELKLAVALADDAPAYSSTSAEDKVLLYAGDTAIVHPYETRGTTTDWYYVDSICSYEHYYYEYFKAGANLEIRPLEGAVAGGTVNVRELPSTDAKAVGTASGGDVLTVLARTRETEKVEGFDYSDYWYEVRTAGGTTGWVFGALVGLMHPGVAYEFASTAVEDGDPDAAIRVLLAAAARFPDAYFFRTGLFWSYTSDEPYFALAPAAELLLGYAYFLKGDTDAARTHYEAALAHGDVPTRTVLKIYDQDYDDNFRFDERASDSATLARVGLGLSYVRSEPDKAAGYFARAIADSESGISTENIRPEYFDALLVRNLIAMYEAGKVTRGCLETVGALLPSKCTYDFAPAYFLLNYGEALERGGNSSEAITLYKRIIEEYPGAYIYGHDYATASGWNTGYMYMLISGRALWRVMRVQTRLGANRDFDAYCGRVAKANDDKRIGFIAYYLAGLALEKAGDAAGASKQYNRAERYYQAGDLGAGDCGYYYDDLYHYLIDRMTGHPNASMEEWLFKGYMDES
jgi:tetratricopeptide (TPR) repeat protein